METYILINGEVFVFIAMRGSRSKTVNSDGELFALDEEKLAPGRKQRDGKYAEVQRALCIQN